MNQQFQEMKNLIDEVEVVSFDVFDTLVKRLVNTPETVFQIVGEQFGIEDFKTSRASLQMQASMKAERELKIPHADLNQIYEHIKANSSKDADWDKVRDTEVQLEIDCLVRNDEMYDIYQYALSQGKRVVITSDMYLLKSHMEAILEKNGYIGYTNLYVSSETHTTKYREDIFKYVCEHEKVSPDKVVHIGDNYASDVENAKKQGLKACHYQKFTTESMESSKTPSLVDKGIADVVCKRDGGFWYNLGVDVGGSLYMGLYRWTKKTLEDIGKKRIYFLARDGYNLYKIFQGEAKDEAKNRAVKGTEDIDARYLHVSRRSLLLAGITKLDENSLKLLPPFTLGQTVREVLDYMGVTHICGQGLDEAGIDSLDYVVEAIDDIDKVRKLYQINKKEFLALCAQERKWAEKYFEEQGFLDEAIASQTALFDCGWNGSSQYLLDRFLEAIGCTNKYPFLYVGIMDTEKSKKQLDGREFYSYLYDYRDGRLMPRKINRSIVIFELFFGSPEESVYRYDETGVVFEKTGLSGEYKEQLCQGIKAYVQAGIALVEKYNIEITCENAMSGIERLIFEPTMEEAKTIGDLENVDGFAVQKGLTKYIARLDLETYKKYPNIELYWIQGLYKRDDIDKKLKGKIKRKLLVRKVGICTKVAVKRVTEKLERK